MPYATTAMMQNVGLKKTMLSAVILPKGTSAPELKSGEIGITVADGGGVGLIDVTFSQTLGTNPKFIVGGRHAATTQLVVNAGDYDASARTLQIRTFVGGTLADLADDADNEVTLMVMFNQEGADDGV